MRPASIWTANISDLEKKQSFESLLLGSGLVLGRLKELIRHRIVAEQDTAYTKTDFSIPNWEVHQARRIGYIAALKDQEKLLEFLV